MAAPYTPSNLESTDLGKIDVPDFLLPFLLMSE